MPEDGRLHIPHSAKESEQHLNSAVDYISTKFPDIANYLQTNCHIQDDHRHKKKYFSFFGRLALKINES